MTAPAAVGPARGGDWPEFRGPTGQGHSNAKDLPIEWSQTQNVTWKQPIPGNGWSSPIYSDGRIYLTTAVASESGAGPSLRALCLDATSGETVWNVEVFRPEPEVADQIHSKNSRASPTPVIDGERLFVHYGHQGTACLDLSGNVIWRRRIEYRPVHGSGGSPVLAGEALVFHCDGGDNAFVIALDRRTGETLWQADRSVDARQSFSFSTPLLIEVDGRRQLVSPGSNMVAAYDPQTGKEIWRVRFDGYSVVPRPVYGLGLVFVCTGFNTPEVMAIRPDGKGDVTETHVEWTGHRSAPNTPSPLLIGESLYLVSDGGIASCRDARTGEMHWQGRVGGDCSASPIYAEGRIYLQTEQGTGVVIEPGQSYLVLAKNPLEERSLASYAVGDGALFIRTAEQLYRIESQ